MKNTVESVDNRQPSILLSYMVFCIVILSIFLGVVVFKLDIHIVLLMALIFVSIVSYIIGYDFSKQIEFMKMSLGQAMEAMMIFIFIGIIIASWIFSGTVPALTYYGLKLITPKFFLPLGLIICSITSLATGTSWGTIGTVGIAMMGIGKGLGINPAMTAGMVICGASFGDKMSPISDTTNLAAAIAGTNVSKHIKSMSYTTIPSYIITLIIFTLIGIRYGQTGIDQNSIDIFISSLTENFNIRPILLLPSIVLLILNIKRFPAIPGMIIGSLLGVILAITVQNFSISEVISGLNYGYTQETGLKIVDTLLCRGGIQNMMYTFSLSCIAISLGGVLEHVGYLHKIIGTILKRVKRDVVLIPLVIIFTTFGTLTMGEVYLSIVINGNLFRNTFEKKGFKNEMLSRLLEEGGTLTQYFIPWSTTGIFTYSMLGVGVISYWKYAILNYLNPILSIVLSLFGLGVLRKSIEEERNGG